MNDLTPLFLLFAVMNKKGFNSIKNAIEAADGFNSKINSISNIFTMLPNLSGILSSSSESGPSEKNYIDTLKSINEILSK